MVLFNTCSVRQHAEDKIYSALGRLKHWKERRAGGGPALAGPPHRVLGVLGCMAQKDRQKIFKRAPHVDLVVGPGQLGRLPQLIERVLAGEGPQLEVSLDRQGSNRQTVEASFTRFDLSPAVRARQTPRQAMVRILFGCDKVLHLLHRAQCPGPRAKPRGGRDRGRGSPVGRRRLP